MITPHILQIHDRMKQVIESRLQITEEQLSTNALPRIIRLCKKFKFTDNESKIATYALVSQSGYDREGRFAYGTDAVSACQFLQIPLQEMLEFLDQDRLHMQQGFFPEVQSSYVLSCSISYDSDFCKALMGSQLKANEFLKLEQTYLADVIAEEPGNEHYRDENLGLKVPETKPSAPKSTPMTKEETVAEGEQEKQGLEPSEDAEEVHPMAIPMPVEEAVQMMMYDVLGCYVRCVVNRTVLSIASQRGSGITGT